MGRAGRIASLDMTHFALTSMGLIKHVTGIGEGLLLGVASSLVGLWLLFSIKPSLRLTLQRLPSGSETWEELSRDWGKRRWEKTKTKEKWKKTEDKEERPHPVSGQERARRRVNKPSASTVKVSAPKKASGQWVRHFLVEIGKFAGAPVTPGRYSELIMLTQESDPCPVRYRVMAENCGLASVVEVEARLWRIARCQNLPDTRHDIRLPVDRLMELPGKWHEARRRADEIELDVGDSLFRFRLPDCGREQISPGKLRGKGEYWDRYLFQVWSKHGFTNFGRVHKLRIECGADGDFQYASPDARHILALAATSIANTAKFSTYAFRKVTKYMSDAFRRADA